MTQIPARDAERYALGTVGVSKNFGGVQALHRLSISIPRGQITCVIGPNGSGKSTLINILSGMLPLDSGMVIVDGEGLHVVHPYEMPDLGITRTFQDVRVFNQISVWDNIMVVLTRRKLLPALLERGKASQRERAEQALRDVGMWDKRNSLAEDLSYGQRKLLEMARAMALDASIYLFDEPFAGLFPQMLTRVKDIFKQLRARGKSILFITHNMDIVRELSDHLIVMDSGELLVEGDVDEVLARREVIEAYLGD
ncbi:MAG: ABC transporter ATP-binding protein [Chloroflexota bacterium]|nr:ABC transporter ATP-binding protein [Chloroflexota bacterium]